MTEPSASYRFTARDAGAGHVEGAQESRLPFRFRLRIGGETVKVALRVGDELSPLQLIFHDETGGPLDADCVVEWPGPRFEEKHIERGVLRLAADEDAQRLKVHFPELIEAAFAEDSVEASAGEAELTLLHQGLRPGTEAVFAFFRGDPEEDEAPALLGEVRAKLAGTDAELGRPQETRVRWPLSGAGQLAAGESVEVRCTVRVKGLELDGGHLQILGPPLEGDE